jgi:uncharacterized membrane protein
MPALKKYYPYLLYTLLFFFSLLMVRITLPYFKLDTQTGFLNLKQSYLTNKVWLVSFYTHVFTSCLLLVAGFTQFSTFILKKHKKLHRGIGKMYVVVLLFISAPAGFIMALNANGGFYSRLAFTLLSVLWIYFTLMAWRTVLQKNFVSHRKYMILSFSLTVSALTLRLWKMIIVMAFHPPPMDAYRIVAWLGWVPNLLFALWLINRKK